MIVFITTARGYGKTFRHMSEATAGRLDLRLLTYDELFKSSSFEGGTYIFTDLDRLSGPDLLQAGVLFRSMKAAGLRVLNDPSRIRSRSGLLRLLFKRGINDFNAYRLEEEAVPERWPVFVRCIGGHLKETTSELCHEDAQLQKVIRDGIRRGFPVSDLVVVEYAGEAVAPGLFRKLSTFRIGDSYFATNNVHDDNWHAKIGKKGIATPDLYRDELRIVRDNPYRDALEEVFRLSHIEYGRADYGFRAGRPQIWEINTKPTVAFSESESHPAPERAETSRLFKQNFAAALEKIDSPAGARVPLTLQRKEARMTREP
jgi:hypothetical protein